jgi:hypothetical protein
MDYTENMKGREVDEHEHCVNVTFLEDDFTVARDALVGGSAEQLRDSPAHASSGGRAGLEIPR